MDIIRAKELLETLADGVNPITGEILSGCDSCNQVEIVRALNTVLRYLEEKTSKNVLCLRMPASHGQKQMKKNFAKCSIMAPTKVKYARISNVQKAQFQRGL